MEKKPISTFVFMDIETTGLPGMGRPIRMTELCLISVSRKSILECRIKNCIPRVKSKISFLVNPNTLIPDEIVDMTGICNTMLEEEKPFNNNKALLVKAFLQNCTQPICLVAHNGLRFDFPLLKEELKDFKSVIPKNLLCADSLVAVRVLSNAPEKGDQLSAVISNTDLLLYEASELIENEFEKQTLIAECVKIEREYCASVAQATNETTPAAEILSSSCSSASRFSNVSSSNDENGPNVSNVKRRLFVDKLSRKRSKLSFALNDVYKSLFNENMSKAHEAESDTVSLLKCCVKIGEPILRYFDENSVLFSDVQFTR